MKKVISLILTAAMSAGMVVSTGCFAYAEVGDSEQVSPAATVSQVLSQYETESLKGHEEVAAASLEKDSKGEKPVSASHEEPEVAEPADDSNEEIEDDSEFEDARETFDEESIPNEEETKEAETKPGFFSRVGSGICTVVSEVASGVTSAVEATTNAVSMTYNTTMDVAAIGAAAVGTYGIYDKAGSAISTCAKVVFENPRETAVLAGAGAVSVGAYRLCKFIKNEIHHLKTGKELPVVAAENDWGRFQRNIISPSVGIAAAVGMYVCPGTTVKVLSPMISRYVIKNRLDKYVGKAGFTGYATTALSSVISVGVGFQVSPISTVVGVLSPVLSKVASKALSYWRQ